MCIFANTLSNTIYYNYNTQNANLLNYESCIHLFANTLSGTVHFNKDTQNANLLKMRVMYIYLLINALSSTAYSNYNIQNANLLNYENTINCNLNTINNEINSIFSIIYYNYASNNTLNNYLC